MVVGFGANPDDLSKVHSPASTEAVVWVADDPSLIFEVQVDGALASTEMQLNCSLIDAHNGSTTTGLSGTEMDSGTTTAPAAAKDQQLGIMRGVNRDDNDNELIWAKIEVIINTHTEATGMVDKSAGTLGMAAI